MLSKSFVRRKLDYASHARGCPWAAEKQGRDCGQACKCLAETGWTGHPGAPEARGGPPQGRGQISQTPQGKGGQRASLPPAGLLGQASSLDPMAQPAEVVGSAGAEGQQTLEGMGSPGSLLRAH